MQEHRSRLTGPVRISLHTGLQRPPEQPPSPSSGIPASLGAGRGGTGRGTRTALVQASLCRGRHSGLSSLPHRCLHSCRLAPAADPAAQQPCPGMRGTRRSRAAAHPTSPPWPPARPLGPPGRSPIRPSSHIPRAAALRPEFCQAEKSVSQQTRPRGHE